MGPNNLKQTGSQSSLFAQETLIYRLLNIFLYVVSCIWLETLSTLKS